MLTAGEARPAISISASRAPGLSIAAAAESAVALAFLLLTLPLQTFAAIWIGVASRRAPLVAHRRIGQYGQPFGMLKLRTMWDPQKREPKLGLVERIVNSEVPSIKAGRDPRVKSPFAALCRKYSIDELPQLWHVMTGRMSLVGPRPLTAIELDQHYGESASEVLQARPGISGLWQVEGRNHLNYPQRKRLDLFLVRHQSLGLYIRIMWRTLQTVASTRGAW